MSSPSWAQWAPSQYIASLVNNCVNIWTPERGLIRRLSHSQLMFYILFWWLITAPDNQSECVDCQPDCELQTPSPLSFSTPLQTEVIHHGEVNLLVVSNNIKVKANKRCSVKRLSWLHCSVFCGTATNLQLMRGSCMATEEGQVGSVVPLQLSMC